MKKNRLGGIMILCALAIGIVLIAGHPALKQAEAQTGTMRPAGGGNSIEMRDIRTGKMVVKSTNIRFVDKRPDKKSYFICQLCAWGFGADDIEEG